MGVEAGSVLSYRSVFHKLVYFLVHAHAVEASDENVGCLAQCFCRDRRWKEAIAMFVKQPSPSQLASLLLTMMK